MTLGPVRVMGAGVVVMLHVVEVNVQLSYKCYDICMAIFLIVPCPLLTDPNNGMINCSLGDHGVLSYEDICSFTCNSGYELTGSSERTCQSDGSWSGSPVSCIIMECPSSSLPMNSMLAESCNSTYQSMCELQCKEGFNGTGDPSYVCDIVNNGLSVMWMADGDALKCEIGINYTNCLHKYLTYM